MTMMAFFGLLQLIGGLILTVGYIPQIVKMVKTKSVDDFSLQYLAGISLGIWFMEAYAIYSYMTVGDSFLSFLITNSISTVLSTTELILFLMYRTKLKK